MLCERCQQREATVHLGVVCEGDGEEATLRDQQHFCEPCLDEYRATTPGMNHMRHLICLSDWYRTKLYDLIEKAHPEVFYADDAEGCAKAGEVVREFLRNQFVKDNIELGDDAFEMVSGDIYKWPDFYRRRDAIKGIARDDGYYGCDHPEPPVIRYRNTDLDLICDVDPAELTAELESRGLSVVVTPGDDGLFYVWCEDSNDTEPEPNVRKLLDAVESLSASARAVWDRCSKREFNLGYDCGDEPWSFNQGLSNDSLRRMAGCGATFRITLYPHRPPEDSKCTIITDNL